MSSINKISGFLSFYKTTAVIVLNIIVFLITIGLLLFIGDNVKKRFFEKETNFIIEYYGEASVRKVYPTLTKDEVNVLLNETWSRPYVYEPFTQFKEREFSGSYVNVSKHGFRITGGAKTWPPDSEKTNIFVFGGSTIFGYGVSDDMTITAYLENSLNKRPIKDNKEFVVYNFGRGFYYSSQERILFEKLLLSGIKPDIAIFVDGLNDFYHYEESPFFTGRLQKFVDETYYSRSDYINNFISGLTSKSSEEDIQKLEYNDSNTLNFVIDRYFNNQRMISSLAKEYGIKHLFVWQPVPTYKYDDKFHLFKGESYNQHSFTIYGYPLIKDRFATVTDQHNLWCADIQENYQEPLYVDQVHYTNRMSREISNCITEGLDKVL